MTGGIQGSRDIRNSKSQRVLKTQLSSVLSSIAHALLSVLSRSRQEVYLSSRISLVSFQKLAGTLKAMDENPNCEFCTEQQPSLTCSDCALNLCEPCCTQVHSKGKLADHKVTSYSCEVCSKIRSEVDCFNCDVGFCAPCFTKLHSRGSMSMHVRGPREPVDSTRQPLLDSLPGQLPEQVGAVVNPSGNVAVAVGTVPLTVTPTSLPRRWPTASAASTASPSTGTSTSTSSSMFCDGTCKTCPPAPPRPGYGLPRVKNVTKEGEDDADEMVKEEEELKLLPGPINHAALPCQHRVNQRLFSYRKTGDGWVGREVVGNIFTDCQSQNQLQFEVREDGIFCNICPPHRAPFSTSGDMSNLRSHAKSDLHLNHLTLRLTGSWPSCKPTGIMPDGSFSTHAAAVQSLGSSTPVIVSPPTDVFITSPGKGFRSPKQLFTPQEHELLVRLGEECGWSKRSNAQIEKFAEQHGIMPRRVKAWIGNHKPTRKKYRYSTGSQSDASSGGIVYSPKTQMEKALALSQGQGDVGTALNISVASTGEDGVTSYTVTNAIPLGDQTTTSVTILPQLPIPGEVVLPGS